MKYVYMVKGFDIEFDLYTDALNFALNKYPGRAVLWDDKQKSQFEGQLDKLHKENPEWKFEVRKAG